MVLLLQDDFIMFQLRVKRSSAAVFFFLFVLSSKYTMIFVRIESTVLNLRFSEKKAACVWMLNVTLGYIGNAENAVMVNIVFPSGCHRVLFLLDTMLIRWRCEGYTMSCCLRNTIGQHRVSIVLPSCSKT